ncbi:MAG: hypothetical protein LBI18_01240 [Planctomycetaceae bacterium]|nr:hypothetical protein [Planctomycetaceae bacterium]
MGDLSPKGRVGGSRLDVVFGRQLVIACRLANRLPTEHRGKSAIADVMFRRNITYHSLVNVFYSFCLYFSVFVVVRWATFRRKVASAIADFAPVSGWQPVSKPVENTNC